MGEASLISKTWEEFIMTFTMIHRKVRTHDTLEEAKVEVFEGLIFESLGWWIFSKVISTHSAKF